MFNQLKATGPVSNALRQERLLIDDLRPTILPLRHHPQNQKRKLNRLIEAFGALPIIVSEKREIIDGVMVWQTLKERGATHIDVITVAGLSPAELKAARIALNRLPRDSRFDKDSVRQVLKSFVEINFDVELTGFDIPEIDSFLELDIPAANLEENGSDIPHPESSPVSRVADIWALGRHRVGCGNALETGFVKEVLGDHLAAVCFIDPPYNVPVAGFVSGKGKVSHREFVQATGEMSSEAFIRFLQSSLSVLKTLCSSSALIYACIDWRHVMHLTVAGQLEGMPLTNVCCWVKSNGGMGGIYRNQHELIVVFQAGPDTPRNNVELGRFGRNRTNVWEYPGMTAFGKQRELLSVHPTVKPVRMIADVLLDVTTRGEIVLDTFLGSGTTLMAAEETGRVCCGVDLDPLYVDVAIRRWQNATGQDAILVSTGETFNAARVRALPAPNGGADVG
jgi:hypothetical protein